MYLKAQRANTGTARHNKEQCLIRQEGWKEGKKNRSKVKDNEQKWGESFKQEFKTFHIKPEGVC